MALRLFFLTVFLFLSLAPAHARFERGGVMLSGGLAKVMTDISGGGSTAQFEGWGWEALTQLEWRWSATFGMLLAYKYGKSDLINTKKDNSSIEKSAQDVSGPRIGFFLQSWEAGYGLIHDASNIHQVSTTSGVSRSSVEGDTQEIFVNYSIAAPNHFRFTIEAQKRDGELKPYDLDELKVLMRMTFLLSL